MTKSRGLRPYQRRGELAAFIEVAVAYTGSECLLWPYQRNKLGYGIVDFRSQGGHRTRAHRIVCERAHGSAPPDKPECAHNCGNPSCVAPAHLRWATHQENLADRVHHGTMNWGARHGQSKLNESDIPHIRSLAKEGMSHSQIAARFGVRRETIGVLLRGGTWAWL